MNIDFEIFKLEYIISKYDFSKINKYDNILNLTDMRDRAIKKSKRLTIVKKILNTLEIKFGPIELSDIQVEYLNLVERAMELLSKRIYDRKYEDILDLIELDEIKATNAIDSINILLNALKFSNNGTKQGNMFKMYFEDNLLDNYRKENNVNLAKFANNETMDYIIKLIFNTNKILKTKFNVISSTVEICDYLSDDNELINNIYNIDEYLLLFNLFLFGNYIVNVNYNISNPEMYKNIVRNEIKNKLNGDRESIIKLFKSDNKDETNYQIIKNLIIEMSDPTSLLMKDYIIRNI